jgi:HNH endonuclease
VNRQALRERYGFRCGYCGVHETDIGAELTVDHFQPRARGGTNASANLVYCCHACNEFKADDWQPESLRRLLHPLQDDPAEHLALSEDGSLRGLTETGSFHIQRLHLNRPALAARRARELRLQTAHAAQRRMVQQLTDLQGELDQLKSQIQSLQQPPLDEPRE